MPHANNADNYLLNNVQVALRALCLRKHAQGALLPEKLWPSTRDVAECCDISIYIARYYLIKLVESNRAYVSPCAEKNSLRWHIVEPTLLIKQRKPRTSPPSLCNKIK